MRRRGDRGFTLVEVMITTLILVVVLGAASQLFVNLLRAYKQQSKIAETGMEGILGLEIMRRDIQHAGFGVPWNGLVSYSEAASGANAVACNPGGSTSPSTNPPCAIGSLDGVGAFGSDYLVVRAASVGMRPAARKWTTQRFGPVTRTWGSPLEDLAGNDRVIVLAPGLDNATFRTLVTGAGFDVAFSNVGTLAPTDLNQTYVVYGIDCTASLRMPFNRADFYIDTASVPTQCAPNTGVLVKAVVGQNNGLLSSPPSPFALLDCVGSVQYRYRLDTNNDGLPDTTTGDADGLAAMTAQQIRDQVKEVQVFILAHEGQRDTAYTHPVNPISVAGVNVNVDVNYRWRLYTMTVRPISLRD